MRVLLSIVLAAALGAGFARTAQAQLGARSVEVEPFVGVTSYDDDLNLDSTIGFGGRVAYNFTDNWALEGTFNYTPGADFDLAGFDEPDNFNAPETRVILAHGNLLYNFTLNQSKLVPFVTAGGGLASFNVDNDDNIGEDSDNDGEVNAGGGLKLFLSPTVALRGDVRHHWIFASIPNQDPGQPNDEKDAETTSNFEFSGGLSFNF